LPNIQHIDRIKANPENNTVLFVFGVSEATTFSIELSNIISQKKLNNVVGVLLGKSKPEEFVIFSGHYDHLGIGKAVNGDSSYNGANDDAAGTTAVIMLAKYFKKRNNNERTILFVTFVAEEFAFVTILRDRCVASWFEPQIDPEYWSKLQD